jgi:hypothetical protein
MMQTCVGAGNLKQYMLFLWYTTVACALSLSVNLCKLTTLLSVPKLTPPPLQLAVDRQYFQSAKVGMSARSADELIWSLVGCGTAAAALGFVGWVGCRQARLVFLGTSTIDEPRDRARIRSELASPVAQRVRLAVLRCLQILGSSPLLWCLPIYGGCRFTQLPRDVRAEPPNFQSEDGDTDSEGEAEWGIEVARSYATRTS